MMKVPDEVVERVATALQNECMALFSSWWTDDNARRFARRALAEIPETQAPEWATPQVLKFLQSGRLMTNAQIINSGNYHFSCRLNSEPDPLSWATPEAKAVLDSLLPENWDPMPGLQWLALRQAYIASLKPKTRVMPERWYCEVGTGIGGEPLIRACSSEAEVSIVRAEHYPNVVIVRHIPSQPVTEE